MEEPLPPPPVQFAQPPPIPARCPYCSVDLHVRAEYAGQMISCPRCNGRFEVPLPPAGLGGTAAPGFNQGIKVCVLISGIVNALAGLFWISTLCGVVIGIPQIVLAVFEIIFFAQADKKPRSDALRQANLLGILEIISGLFNLVSLVCGILVLVFASRENA